LSSFLLLLGDGTFALRALRLVLFFAQLAHSLTRQHQEMIISSMGQNLEQISHWSSPSAATGLPHDGNGQKADRQPLKFSLAFTT
ncbi:hypothetical protein PENTCL1PPCAC_2359, partial [Pristionchus entomophagus]